MAPQVVFEVLSPGNTAREMATKRAFYDRYGAEEYYEIDPEARGVRGWLRGEEHLEPVGEMGGWESPRLGVRFVREADGLKVYRPDGRKLESYDEVDRQREEARAERLAAQLRALGVEPEA